MREILGGRGVQRALRAELGGGSGGRREGADRVGYKGPFDRLFFVFFICFGEKISEETGERSGGVPCSAHARALQRFLCEDNEASVLEEERVSVPVARRRSSFSPQCLLCSLFLSLSLPISLFLLTFPSFPTAPWRSLVAAATMLDASAPFKASAAAARMAFALLSLVVVEVVAPSPHFSCASSSTLSAASMAWAVTVEVVFCFLTTLVASSSAAESRELDMGFRFDVFSFFFKVGRKRSENHSASHVSPSSHRSTSTNEKTTAPTPPTTSLTLLSGGQRPPAELVDAIFRLEKRCFSRTDAWDGEDSRFRRRKKRFLSLGSVRRLMMALVRGASPVLPARAFAFQQLRVPKGDIQLPAVTVGCRISACFEKH